MERGTLAFWCIVLALWASAGWFGWQVVQRDAQVAAAGVPAAAPAAGVAGAASPPAPAGSAVR
jgi:hypothetical protein